MFCLPHVPPFTQTFPFTMQFFEGALARLLFVFCFWRIKTADAKIAMPTKVRKKSFLFRLWDFLAIS